MEAACALLPPRLVSNETLAAGDTAEAARLLRQTGIHTRRYAEPSEATSDLASQALKPLLESAGTTSKPPRALLVATTSPDYPSPATASYVHAKLGLPASTLAFDVASSCSSFLSAVLAGLGLVETSSCVAVVASEVKHKALGNDARLRSLFADGAGALLLSRGNGDEGFLHAYTRLDAEFAHHIQIPVGGSRAPVTLENWAEARLTMREPRLVFRHTVKAFCDAIEACWKARELVCAKLGLSSNDVPGFVYAHQANANILQEVRERLPFEVAARMPLLMEDIGNMVCASLPVLRTRMRVLERLWTPAGFRQPAYREGLVAEHGAEGEESVFILDRAGGFFLNSLSPELQEDLHACLQAGLPGHSSSEPWLSLLPREPFTHGPRIDVWVCAGGGFQTIGLLHGKGLPHDFLL